MRLFGEFFDQCDVKLRLQREIRFCIFSVIGGESFQMFSRVSLYFFPLLNYKYEMRHQKCSETLNISSKLRCRRNVKEKFHMKDMNKMRTFGYNLTVPGIQTSFGLFTMFENY